MYDCRTAFIIFLSIFFQVVLNVLEYSTNPINKSLEDAFFIIFNYVMMAVSGCTCGWGALRGKGIRYPGAGVTGNYELPV